MRRQALPFPFTSHGKRNTAHADELGSLNGSFMCLASDSLLTIQQPIARPPKLPFQVWDSRSWQCEKWKGKRVQCACWSNDGQVHPVDNPHAACPVRARADTHATSAFVIVGPLLRKRVHDTASGFAPLRSDSDE